MIKLRKESDVKDTNFPTESVEFGAGDAFFQGVFTEYGVAQGEFVDKDRTGGFGSTGK
jgi:dUTPase